MAGQQILKIILFVACFICSCSLRPEYKITDLNIEGTPNYQRKIILILEKETSYARIPNVQVKIEVKNKAKLLSPANGIGQTNHLGELELIFKPYPEYDQTLLDVGDIVADYPIEANIILKTPNGTVYETALYDKESFARYQDPIYSGLNRNPDLKPLFFNLVLE